MWKDTLQAELSSPSDWKAPSTYNTDVEKRRESGLALGSTLVGVTHATTRTPVVARESVPVSSHPSMNISTEGQWNSDRRDPDSTDGTTRNERQLYILAGIAVQKVIRNCTVRQAEHPPNVRLSKEN